MFAAVPELCIGPIVEVRGYSLRIELDAKLTELTRIYHGQAYPIGQVASVIKIPWGRHVLLAYVSLLRMRSEIALEEGKAPLPRSEDARILEADLFAEGQWIAEEEDEGGIFDFQRGIRRYPMPRQKAYITTQDELRAIFQGAEREQEAERSMKSIRVGSYVGSTGTQCYVNLDKLFGLHSAVLGSTGSGKSGTVTALIHSLLDPQAEVNKANALRPRLLVLDPHGEYAAAFKDRCVVYRPYDVSGDDEDSYFEQLMLPYWLMTGEEFRELVIAKTEREATRENNIVYKALKHARMVQRGWIEEACQWVGEPITAERTPDRPRVIKGYETQVSAYDRDLPDPFSLDEFVRHIDWEQSVERGSGNKWKRLSAGNFRSHAKVLDKVNVLRTDPRLNFLMEDYQDGVPDLPAILSQFVGAVGDCQEQPTDVRILDLSGIPNEVAGTLTAAVARLLFQYKLWQTREERERDPILLVCEEAHRYVPDSGLAEYESAQSAIRRIAKEGRKYGIGLMLISQRPADVERTVLSQCNTWFVLRLTNSTDQEHVKRFLPDSLSGLTGILPALARRESILVGEAAAVPARIEIRRLSKDQLPDSHDISFVDGWHKPLTSRTEIERVVRRWRRQDDE